MSNTDVAVRDDLTPEVLDLLAQQEADLGEVVFQTPILKLAQALTKEVKEGDIEPGEFINTLTGESYGTEVEFIVAYYQQGRSASAPNGRYYVAVGTDTIPESWADLVGEEFVGTPFDEHPDAEEQFKKAVNAKQIEWGKGPLISTTYVYTGLAFPPSADPDEELEPMPVRITFLRSTKNAHTKIMTLKTGLRLKAFWDIALTLSSAPSSKGRNDFFVVNVKKARNTTPEEKGLAVQLAQAVVAGRTNDNAEAAEAGSARVAPEAAPGGVSL